MARVRARRIYRPQIVSARREWGGWVLIVLLLTTPWPLSLILPWLPQVSIPLPASTPSLLVRQAKALRQEIVLQQQRNNHLIARIAQLELELRIDRHARKLAAEQMHLLRLERDQLTQTVADWHQILGANDSLELVPVATQHRSLSQKDSR